MSEDLTIANVAAAEAGARAGSGWLRRSVFALDAYLRLHQHIFEFTDQANCILRVARATAPRDLELSDGTAIQAGDPLLDLHLWNEHVPAIPPAGVTLRWAATAARRARDSLRALAQAAASGGLPDFVALRGCLRFDGRLLEAPFARCGFDTIIEPSATLGAGLRDLGENCLTGMLIWAYNPAGLGHARLMQGRRCVWMSRQQLLARHRPRSH